MCVCIYINSCSCISQFKAFTINWDGISNYYWDTLGFFFLFLLCFVFNILLLGHDISGHLEDVFWSPGIEPATKRAEAQPANCSLRPLSSNTALHGQHQLWIVISTYDVVQAVTHGDQARSEYKSLDGSKDEQLER